MSDVKVSFHNGMGTDTCAHNDRSMYDFAYKDRDGNRHWDCYGLGDAGDPAPSVHAEMRYYEDRFGEVLAEINRRYLRQSHPERVKSMKDFRLAHLPRESIIQLGASEDRMTSAWLELAVPRFVEKLRDCGCEVISWDIHVDETEETSTGKPIGTPHAHIRWIGVDSKGKPNLAGCLAEHGVNVAQVRWTEEEAERHNERARRKVRAGDLKGPQVNNRLTTLTTELRAMLETLADEYLSGKHGPVRENGLAGSVDRERVAGAEHVSVPEYKRRRRAQEREAQADAYVDEALRRAAAAEAQQREAERVIAEAAAVSAKAVRMRDAAEEELDAANKTRETALYEAEVIRGKAAKELSLARSDREIAALAVGEAYGAVLDAKESVKAGAIAVERFIEQLCAVRPDLRDWLVQNAVAMRESDVSGVSEIECDVTQLERDVEQQTRDAETRASVPTQTTSPTPPSSTVVPPVAPPKPSARRTPHPGSMGRTPSSDTPQRGY